MNTRRLSVSLAVAVALLGSWAGMAAAPTPSEQPAAVPTWQEVEKLVGDRRARAALEKVDLLLAAARERGDEAEWTRALIRAAQLESALGADETAVRRLRETPWPEQAIHRLPLQLATRTR